MTDSKPSTTPQAWSPASRLHVDVLALLRSLSPDQQVAVRWAIKRWVEVATREGYEPITEWRNFANEVDHSALLVRLFSGKDALPERPPTRYSYPDYDAVEKP